MTALAAPPAALPMAVRTAPGARGWGVVSALLGLAGLPAHAWLLLAHGHGPFTTGVLAVMTLWCAGCAGTVLRGGGTDRALAGLLAMAAAMALLHAGLVAGVPGVGGGHHHGSGAAAASGEAPAASRAMLAVVGLELAVAFTAALGLRRRA